jgi:hypothetical protein
MAESFARQRAVAHGYVEGRTAQNDRTCVLAGGHPS